MSDIHQQPPHPHPRVGQEWWASFIEMTRDWPRGHFDEAVREIVRFLDEEPDVRLVGNDEPDVPDDDVGPNPRG